MPNSGDSNPLLQPDGSMPLPFGSATGRPSNGSGQHLPLHHASDAAGDEQPAAAAGAAAAGAAAAAAAAGAAPAALAPAGPAGDAYEDEGLGEEGSGALFSDDTQNMEEVKRRSEEEGNQPAPPQPTLRLEDLPPLSSGERLFG